MSGDWVPDWARRAVLYHIYPLGFLDAPLENDQSSPPTQRLADLRRWYEHILNLGVRAIYFGPVFESHTHGYDTIDYFRIDRRLGDEGLFREILAELHELNIRVILDGVFNHTGRDFFAFRDLREKGRDSAYIDWYTVNWADDSPYHDGFDYYCWHGVHSLPALNLENPDTRNYIFEVARMWLGDIGVDGWRLDVAGEIDPSFWWEFRRVCKRANPDSFLLGEMWGGDYRTWVAHDLLDSGTNYQLYQVLDKAFNEANLWTLKSALDRAYDPELGVYRDLKLNNFTSNHDVTRIRDLLHDPRHVFAAMILLLTIPGIPSLYYGEEIGMRGRKEDGDEALRQPMLAPDGEWPEYGEDLYREIQRLVKTRLSYPALVDGDYLPLQTGYTFFSFLRSLGDQQVIVAFSIDDKAMSATIPVQRVGIPDGTRFRDVLDRRLPTYTVEEGRLEIERLYPGWGRILVNSQPS
ncbi:MAG: alpha-amylase [Chloroflexi bacterium]|nr:alpha-amylase [Chloroflexota bacterium]